VEVEQESEHVCQEGDIFVLDGEMLEVKRVDGDGDRGLCIVNMEGKARRRIGWRSRDRRC
jgi:hypothetical protein